MLKLFFIIGVICIIISGIFIEAWTGGYQQRGNFHTETKEDRHTRTRIGMISGLVGLISLSVAGFIYFL